MERTLRLAHELVNRLSALEGFEAVPPDKGPPGFGVYDEEASRTRAQHYRVVTLQRTKQKLEKWFLERDIPIRIVYAEKYQANPIPLKGVITLVYRFMQDQGPPTAWMIVHNLSHGIFDYFTTSQYENPYMFQKKHGLEYRDKMKKTISDMPLAVNKKNPDPFKYGGYRYNKEFMYPTTRAQQIGKVVDTEEGFHELFTQWVVTGRVRLDHPSPSRTKEWANKLDQLFRSAVDHAARDGTVLINV